MMDGSEKVESQSGNPVIPYSEQVHTGSQRDKALLSVFRSCGEHHRDVKEGSLESRV